MPESEPRMAQTGDGRIRDSSPGTALPTQADEQKRALKEGDVPEPVGSMPGSSQWRDSTPGVEGGETPEFSKLFMTEQVGTYKFVVEADEADENLPTGDGYIECDIDGCGWIGRPHYLGPHKRGWHGEGPLGDVVRRRVAEKAGEAEAKRRNKKKRKG